MSSIKNYNGNYRERSDEMTTQACLGQSTSRARS